MTCEKCGEELWPRPMRDICPTCAWPVPVTPEPEEGSG
jgi:hypothetical protein